MDTIRVEIISKQLDKVVDSVTQHPSGLTQGEVVLLAAAIGASAAILSQLLVFLLTRFKERANLRKELIADERRIAFLLTEYYKELVMHKVHKMYWYRTSEIQRHGTDDGIDSHERHFVSNQRSFETMTKIRVMTSDYFKVVTHFTNLVGQRKVITQVLTDIKAFNPRKASEFSEVKTYNELLVAQTKEETELNKVYLYFSDCFNKINADMTKKM
jgi:hypothetical protein